jgi:hypothetical protein
VSTVGRPSRPVDVAVVLPDDWWVVPLQPAQARHRSVRRLVERQFNGVDQPILRRDVTQRLGSAADEAAAANGRWMAVSLQRAGGVPVPASLVLTWLELGPPHGDGHVADLVAQLTGPAEHAVATNADEVTSAALPCGRVVRRVRAATPADATLAAAEIEPIAVDYFLEFPSADGMALLSFSTPLAVLREPLIELFDAVVGTAQWSYPPPNS